MINATQTYNPLVASKDAKRDIASGKIGFCFVGGRCPIAPGIPDGAYQVINRYPRISIGPQGCYQDQGSDIRFEYARRYNAQMWSYVSQKNQKI